MTGEFWDDPAMRDALRNRHLGQIIRAWRTHPQQGRQAVSQNLVAAWMGITQTQLSRIETGGPVVHLDRLIEWAKALRIPPHLLWFTLPTNDSSDSQKAPSRSELHDPGRTAPAETRYPDHDRHQALRSRVLNYRWDGPAEPMPLTQDDVVNRRAVLYGLMGTAGAAGSSSLAARLEALRRGLDDRLSGDVVDSADVDEWERVIDQYAHDVGLLSAGRVLPQLATDLEDIQASLRGASGKQRADLAHVCSRLSALIAITLLNLDEAQMARRYWRTATRAADQTSDLRLRALIRGRRAVFSLYDQRSASTVLALADEAIEVAPGIACTGTVSAHAARSQALALLGDHRAALDALDETFKAFARLPEATVTDRSSQWGWSEQRLRHVESHVHSYAGRTHDAARAQNVALSLYPAQAYQGPAQIELHRAVSMIVAGDPSEGARHTVRTVSGLPAHVRDDALVRRTAALALDAIPAGAAKLPAVSQARDLLALPIGPS
ncbi:helix-turn-helix domain-containing protein [Polymorphospora sp. A560]